MQDIEHLSIRIPAKTKGQIEILAHDDHRSITATLIVLIEQEVARRAGVKK